MGEPKGLLAVPGSAEPIVEFLVRCGREAGFDSILVGESTPYERLAEGVPRIDDEPPGAGPLAGLHAALRHALRTGRTKLVAIACDMPYVTPEALEQARDHWSRATVVAPKRAPGAPWEPAAISRGERSFQTLFASIEVEALPLSEAIERALQDWDSPADIAR